MNKKGNNPIRKKYYIAMKVCLLSPLSVSSGENRYTDSDVMRNGDGEVFVPGSSIAGAFRNYISIEDRKKKADCFMGFSDGEMGKMSPLFVSDLYFEEVPVVGVRECVQLDDNRIAKNGSKFNNEIIETGATGNLFFEYQEREKDTITDILSKIYSFASGVQSGEIRFGSKKNRGYGRMKILEVYKKEFTSENRIEWLEFLKNYPGKLFTENCKVEDWEAKADKKESQYIVASVPLRLSGGISIRTYSAKAGEADYEHIKCNGEPVIPGSSWNGVIRARTKKILQQLQVQEIEKYINEWFGYVTKENAQQSRVVFAESIIQGGKYLNITRNSINRFDASTKQGALYSERTCIGGKTYLKIQVKKEDGYLGFLGILLLIIEDIQNGYLAIGGQTAIGRGIFESVAEEKIIWSEKLDEIECRKALYKFVNSKEEGENSCK